MSVRHPRRRRRRRPLERIDGSIAARIGLEFADRDLGGSPRWRTVPVSRVERGDLVLVPGVDASRSQRTVAAAVELPDGYVWVAFTDDTGADVHPLDHVRVLR